MGQNENQTSNTFEDPVTTENKSLSFFDVLKPLNTDLHETLELISATTKKEVFIWDIFNNLILFPDFPDLTPQSPLIALSYKQIK